MASKKRTPEELVPTTDPYGFAAILNAHRAAAGLSPVAYDHDLSAWAAQNNAEQSSRGLGHHGVAKAANQLIVAGNIALVAEALVFLQAQGVDVAAAVAVLAVG